MIFSSSVIINKLEILIQKLFNWFDSNWTVVLYSGEFVRYEKEKKDEYALHKYRFDIISNCTE